MELTNGAIFAMYESTDDPASVDPILQVLSAKKVNAAGAGQDRYRLILSDGVHFAQAMLTTALNHLVAGDTPDITKNAIVKLPTYAVNVVQNRRIIIVLAIEFQENHPDKIGNPVSIETAVSNSGAAPAAAPAAAASDAPRRDAVSEPSAGMAGRGAGSNASKTPAARRPQGGAAQRGARGAESLANAPVYPIESLSPYQNKWTIRARVTSKSDIRHWSNQRGDGKLFSVNLLDETGEIRATGFNEACDKLYPILEEGKVFRISRARVNIAKKQFSNLANEYEITFENNTEVEPVDETEEKDVPQVQFSFTQLSDLTNIDKDGTCDVLGIVQDNGAVSEITTKATQKQIKKRELTIVDRSQYAVRVTLWGRQAENWQELDNGIVAIKGVKVGDFGGRSLSVSGSSTVAIDPDIPEAHELRGWYDTQGQTQSFQSFSSMGAGGGAGSFKPDAFKALKDVVDENLGMSDKPDYFSTRATVTYVKGDNLSYPACPTERCNKKMSQEGDRQWRCEKCEMTYEAPQYRYIISMCVNDYTSQIWVSGFNEVGQDLFGKSADEMQALKEDDDPLYQATITAAVGKCYNLSIKAKADSFGDQTRVRYQIQSMAHVDWAAAAKTLASQIEAW
ncbi:Replication factor A protein 1 [Rhodotorula kratochvilovae]